MFAWLLKFRIETHLEVPTGDALTNASAQQSIRTVCFSTVVEKLLGNSKTAFVVRVAVLSLYGRRPYDSPAGAKLHIVRHYINRGC